MDVQEFCCVKCINESQQTKDKIKRTNKERYGVEHVFQAERVKNQIKQTNIERYGVQCIFQSKIFKDQISQTKLEKYGDKNYNNREKSNATFNQHKVEDENFLKEIDKKCKETKLKNHGDPNYTNPEKNKQTRYNHNDGKYRSTEEQQKIQNTFKQNHNGLTSSFQLPGVYDKAIKTFEKNYNSTSPLTSPIVQSKIKETNIKRYGVDNVWKSPEIFRKSLITKIEKYGSISTVNHYTYNNINFDSSWELVFWIYCIDHKIDIQKPKIKFEYYYNDKLYWYFPDFIVNGKLVEIKGDHFFKVDGTMQNPYDHTQDGIYEAKHQCMLNNNVQILLYQNMSKYFEYIDNTYGKDYIEKFKKHS